jgi:AcrR family transcriptional regulator
MRVFWRKGYQATTLADLTKAMAINRPSLYAAFGNKRALFLKVLDHFADGPTTFMKESLAEQSSREVVRHMLEAAVAMATAPRNPPGCLWVKGALSSQDRMDSFRLEFFRQRTEGEERLRRRLEEAVATGDLPADADATALARYVEGVRFGMAVQAATGASRNELMLVVATVLRTWPGRK